MTTDDERRLAREHELERLREARAPWHWGVWIGASLAFLGLVNAIVGGVAGVQRSFTTLDGMKRPSPSSLESGLHQSTSSVAQGVGLIAVGALMLTASLFALHRLRVKEQQASLEDWR